MPWFVNTKNLTRSQCYTRYLPNKSKVTHFYFQNNACKQVILAAKENDGGAVNVSAKNTS